MNGEDPMDTMDYKPDQPATVLIVDDDPGARLLLGTALEMAGFRVATAADGAAALDAFRARPSDCIVLDVVMPGMNGFETCVALRDLPGCRHVPILMQTSLDDMESVNRAYTAGATDFSSKGVNPMLLAQRVKFLVRAKRTQDRFCKTPRCGCSIACAIASGPRRPPRTHPRSPSSRIGWSASAATSSAWFFPACLPRKGPRPWRAACSSHWRARSASRDRRYRSRRQSESASTRSMLRARNR
jgi:CheY-like chemotaxis protein